MKSEIIDISGNSRCQYISNKGSLEMVDPNMESALNKVVKSGDCGVKTELDDCLDS